MGRNANYYVCVGVSVSVSVGVATIININVDLCQSTTALVRSSLAEPSRSGLLILLLPATHEGSPRQINKAVELPKHESSGHPMGPGNSDSKMRDHFILDISLSIISANYYLYICIYVYISLYLTHHTLCLLFIRS